MTVGDLRKLIAELPDEMPVVYFSWCGDLMDLQVDDFEVRRPDGAYGQTSVPVFEIPNADPGPDEE